MSRSDLEENFAFQLRVACLPAPERQYRFSETRRWSFDFCWPDRMVALEIEGGTFIGGRHNRGAGFEADCEKYGEAALRGWLVIRATGGMVDDGRALRLVERALATREATA